MYRFLRPLLFTLPPEAAHAVTLGGLRFAHRFGLINAQESSSQESVELMGVHFPNRIGLAAGLDKNGTCINALGALGFGFLEIGTVTPRAQSGNAKPRLFRLIEDRALVNRMGFPNDGVLSVCHRLKTRKYKGICGVNIGKNAATPLSSATGDYVACMEAVYVHADYIAVNISSPNTVELRRMQHGKLLSELLLALTARRSELHALTGRRVPLLVKLTTDLSDNELDDAASTAVACGVDGVIASNTTIHREGLRSALGNEEGGLSGAPLLPYALRAVSRVRAAVGPKVAIVGVGGVADRLDAQAMRSAGADLVQIYTGLVYQGPGLVANLRCALKP